MNNQSFDNKNKNDFNKNLFIVIHVYEIICVNLFDSIVNNFFDDRISFVTSLVITSFYTIKKIKQYIFSNCMKLKH